MAAPQVVAAKALAGDFGKLDPWQREGYERIAAGHAEKKIAWVTQYSQYECSTRTASGRRVESGRTLAMLDVPFGTCVLIDLPTGFTLRQVWDRGSRRNLPRARRKGAQTWCDIYRDTRSRRVLNTTWVRPIWVAR
jgi:hypothetical protein